jgi:hypothetical protein
MPYYSSSSSLLSLEHYYFFIQPPVPRPPPLLVHNALIHIAYFAVVWDPLDPADLPSLAEALEVGDSVEASLGHSLAP